MVPIFHTLLRRSSNRARILYVPTFCKLDDNYAVRLISLFLITTEAKAPVIFLLVWGRALVLFWTRLTGTFSHSLPLGRSGYGLVAAFTSPMIPMSMSCPGLSFMWVVSINITSSILLGNSQGFGGNGYAKGKGIWPLVQGFHRQSMYAETPFYFQAD